MALPKKIQEIMRKMNQIENANRRPGAGGGDNTSQGLQQEEPGFLDKLISGGLKLKDVVPNIITDKIGRGFSNAKLPVGYNTAVNPGKFVRAALNEIGGKDQRLWEDDINPPLEVGQLPIGNQFKPIQEYDTRDALNRKALGLDDKQSLRGKNWSDVGLIDQGNNNYEMDRNSETGMNFYKKFDPEAGKWAVDQIFGGYNKDNPDATKPELRKHQYPVMSHVNDKNMNFAGEGEDEGGYYNMVRLNDIWDYKLNEGEKIEDVTNLGRTILNQFTDPVNVTGTSKVYIPNIKKQQRKKRVLRIPGADVPNPDI